MLLLFLIITIVACNNGGSKNKIISDTSATPVVTDTKREVGKDILDTLNALPFVIEASRNIDSATQHQHGMSYIIDTTDTELDIRAGYNGPDRFETYFIFAVDKKTRAITVEDVISGDTVTPEEFEKRRKANQK